MLYCTVSACVCVCVCLGITITAVMDMYVCSRPFSVSIMRCAEILLFFFFFILIRARFEGFIFQVSVVLMSEDLLQLTTTDEKGETREMCRRLSLKVKKKKKMKEAAE